MATGNEFAISAKEAEQTSYQPLAAHYPEDDDVHLDDEFPVLPLRPVVAAVKGLCPHPCRSADHTCGADECLKLYDPDNYWRYGGVA